MTRISNRLINRVTWHISVEDCSMASHFNSKLIPWVTRQRSETCHEQYTVCRRFLMYQLSNNKKVRRKWERRQKSYSKQEMLTFARGKSYNRKSAKIAQHPVSINRMLGYFRPWGAEGRWGGLRPPPSHLGSIQPPPKFGRGLPPHRVLEETF